MPLAPMLCTVLNTANGRKKTLSSVYSRTACTPPWRTTGQSWLSNASQIPARPSIPELLEPREVLECKTGSKAGRNARLQGVPIFN